MHTREIVAEMIFANGGDIARIARDMGMDENYFYVFFSYDHVPRTDTLLRITDTCGFDLVLTNRETGKRMILKPPDETLVPSGAKSRRKPKMRPSPKRKPRTEKEKVVNTGTIVVPAKVLSPRTAKAKAKVDNTGTAVAPTKVRMSLPVKMQVGDEWIVLVPSRPIEPCPATARTDDTRSAAAGTTEAPAKAQEHRPAAVKTDDAGSTAAGTTSAPAKAQEHRPAAVKTDDAMPLRAMLFGGDAAAL